MKRPLLFIIILVTLSGCNKVQTPQPMTEEEALTAFSDYDKALIETIQSNASDCNLLGNHLLQLINAHHISLKRAFAYLNTVDRYSQTGQVFFEKYDESRPSRRNRTLMKAIDDCGKTPDVKEFKRLYSDLMLSDIVPKSI